MMDHMKLNKSLAFAFPVIFLALLLGGCAQIQKLKSPELVLPLAAIPDYAVGERYDYDDGRSETVVAKEGRILTWRTNNGVVRKTYNNFAIPYLSWQTATRRGTSKTNAKADMLWPLQVGNAANFDFVTTAEDNDGGNSREYKQTWQCKVEGTETVRIVLGSYDTFKIVCHRYNGKTWRQTRTFNYAPLIGHFVLRHDSYLSGPSGRRELVSYGFDSSVFSATEQQALGKTVQRALLDNSDGEITYWRGAKGTPSIGINTLTTTTNSKGLACRSYEGVFSDNQRVRTNRRYACRRADGLWVNSLIEQQK